MLVLDAALDAGGQHMLHTAGLTLPDSDALVLIHAPSGTGKTTTSLALASQGFGLCSDDAMILNVASGKAVAWGLPRHVKIHRKTAEMVPLVSPCLGPSWDRNGEQAVSLERLSEIVRVEDSGPRPVAALLHLARSADDQNRLVAMARTDAMVALAADNVRTGMTGLLPLQKRRLETIVRLVSTVPTFTLEVGREAGRCGGVDPLGVGAGLNGRIGRRGVRLGLRRKCGFALASLWIQRKASRRRRERILFLELTPSSVSLVISRLASRMPRSGLIRPAIRARGVHRTAGR